MFSFVPGITKLIIKKNIHKGFMLVSGNSMACRINAVNSKTDVHSNILDSHKLKKYMTGLRMEFYRFLEVSVHCGCHIRPIQ